MTSKIEKLRAVFLAALMIGSVLAFSVAFSGAAAAANERGPNSDWRTADGSGDVGSGATVFQGSDDITFKDGSETVSPAELERTAGASEGEVLEQPIAQDAATGTYAVNGNSSNFNVTVQSPRITTLEVQNNGRSDVSGGILTTDQNDATVLVEYNFNNSEDIELTVEDQDGLDVTNEIVSNNSATDNGDAVRFGLNPSAVDEGEYTFTAEGVDDLDFGDASDVVTTQISSDRTASLSVNNDEVTQGENNRYTVEDSPEGNYHVVTIERSDFRDGITAVNASSILRNVGDVTETGVYDEGNETKDTDPTDVRLSDVDYAYAVTEIDGGNGVGSVETQFLDDSSVTVDLYPANANVSNEGLDGDVRNGSESDDDVDFDVVEGDVSLNSPTGEYIIGSEATVSGDASAGSDEVALYARNNNDYELVTVDGSPTIEVDSDDTFEEEGVTLSGDSNGNDILSLEGTYRLGIIDSQDAAVDNTTRPDGTLTTSEFNSGISSTSSIVVTDTTLSGSFTTYDGQIASDDSQIDVEGEALGKNDVVVAFVDSRGNAEAQVVSVEDDGTIDEEDILLGDLSEGSVSAHILSSGRDDVFGEEGAGPDTVTGLRDNITGTYESGSSSGDQVRERILADTVDDTASDDLIVTESFRLSDGLTTIESVSGTQTGGTLSIEGQTNRVPDDNTITVELLNEDQNSVLITSTDSWGTDAQWSVEMDLSNVDAGEYTLEADDGDNTDRTSVTITEEAATADFQISELSPMDVTVTAGDIIDVSATVTNEGNAEDTQDVQFRVDGNTLGSQEVSLDAGASETVEFTGIDTSGLDAGDYTHGVFTDDGSQTATLTVEPQQTQEADFQVTELNPMDVTVTQGDTVDASATVTNEGNAEATQTVEFRVGGDALESQDVTLAPGESQSVDVSVTADIAPGDYTHGIFTDDDSQTATLTVEQPEDPSTPEPTESTPEPTDDDGETTTTTGPGFGVLVSVLALLGAALLAARRNN